MSEHHDIVIVGAGLAGAATAYHLKRAGVRDVVLLEKEDAPGQHSSGLNAAMIRERVNDTDLQALTTEGAAALRDGVGGEFRQVGSFLIGVGDEDVSPYCSIARGRGLWCPRDGVVDPAAVLAAYLRGQDMRCRTELLDWRGDPRGVALRTSAGTMTARLLVNAAGPWAGVIGDLPIACMNRHLFVTPPMEAVDPAWPFVWDVVNGLYFRPESGGLMLCVCDEQAREPGDYRINHDVQVNLAEALLELQPALADVAVRTCWTGQRMFAPDRRFVIGFDARHPQLFHVAGLGGHGVTASFAVGRLAAQCLTGTLADAGAFDPQRLVPDGAGGSGAA